MNSYADGKGWAEGSLDIYNTWLHLAYTKQGGRRNIRINPPLKEIGLVGGGWVQDTVGPDSIQHIWIFINVEAHDSFLALADTIAHESFHVAEAIAQRASMPLSGEPGAYLVGYISAWIWSRIPLSIQPPRN